MLLTYLVGIAKNMGIEFQVVKENYKIKASVMGETEKLFFLT